MPEALSTNHTGPGVGYRDPGVAEAVRRAEAASEPLPTPEGLLGRTRHGWVVREDGRIFYPGPYLDVESLPVIG